MSDAGVVDCLVVGGGPAGLTAAVTAAKAGHAVAMVERNLTGGTCVNFGCTPSKALLRAARADGFATEDGEVTLGVRSVGVAVLDHAGWPAAAVAVSWPVDAERDAGAIAALVADAATQLRRRIHG